MVGLTQFDARMELGILPLCPDLQLFCHPNIDNVCFEVQATLTKGVVLNPFFSHHDIFCCNPGGAKFVTEILNGIVFHWNSLNPRYSREIGSCPLHNLENFVP